MNRVLNSLVFVLLVALFSCTSKPVPPTLPTPVNVDTVKAQKVLYYDKYPSTTQALSQVDLRPEVQGYITGIYFLEGSHVSKGQKLYEIDQRLFQSAYDQAMANLKVAQGNQVQAQQDADRYTYLNNQDAVAKQLYDHAIIALDNAKSSVKAAEEAVNTAKTNFTYSVIYAPFDGTVGFSQVKMGNMVSVGATVLNTISTDNPMAVDFLVSEAQLTQYQQLEDTKQNTVDSLFTIVLPDNSTYPYPGKISVIDRAVDPQTGTIRIRVVFPNPQYKLRVGMSCIVKVRNQEMTPQIVIPARAVVEQMGEYFVFTIKDTLILSASDSAKKEKKEAADSANTGPQWRAFQRKVTMGQSLGPDVLIKGGLNEGEVIVVDGVQALHDGSRIALASNKGAAGPTGTEQPKDGKAKDSDKKKKGDK
jgi:membrane fusion protein (multidrug efflux system)